MSILLLPDDILSRLLSFLPLDFQTALSEGCERMAVIVEQQQKSEDRRRVRKVESDQLLTVFCPDSCKLINTDVRIDKIRMRDGWKETGLIQILNTFPHIQLSADAWAYESFVDHFEWHPHDERLIRSRITNFRTNSGILSKFMDLNLVNLTRLRVWGSLSREELQLILQSHARLTKLDIMTDVENMDLLCTTPHKLQVFKLYDTSEGKVDYLNFIRFLEQKGHHLIHLELSCRADWMLRPRVHSPDLMAFLCHNCKSLKKVKMFKFLTNFYLEYEDHQLRLWSFYEDSMQPFLTFFPRTRSFQISTYTSNMAIIQRWKRELKDFAAAKRKHMIRAEIRMITGGPPERRTDSNLRLTVMNHN